MISPVLMGIICAFNYPQTLFQASYVIHWARLGSRSNAVVINEVDELLIAGKHCAAL